MTLSSFASRFICHLIKPVERCSPQRTFVTRVSLKTAHDNLIYAFADLRSETIRRGHHPAYIVSIRQRVARNFLIATLRLSSPS